MDRDVTQPTSIEATESDARREFIKKLGKASAAAPAVALLMAANFKDAQAADPYGTAGGSGSGSGSGSS